MQNRNDSLDFIRGAAVLLVVALHTSENFAPAFSVSRGFSSAFGSLGVQLFFVVSGFTMMLTFGDRVDRQSVTKFYVRRFFRIAPLFWLAALLYLAKDGLGPRYWAPDGISARDVGLTFGFLQWIDPSAMNCVVPGGWSIAVEMLFYSSFPIFAYLFHETRWKGAPYALVIVIYGAGQLAKAMFLKHHFSAQLPPISQHLVDEFFFFWLPNQIIAFGFGFALFEIIERKRIPAVGLILLSAGAIYSHFNFMILVLFGMALIILKTNIHGRAMSALGQASYSIYLIHFAIMGGVKEAAARLGMSFSQEAAFLLVVSLSLLVATKITKPLIEDRSVQWGKALVGRFRAPVRAPAALA